jgi:hypothetical protein
MDREISSFFHHRALHLAREQTLATYGREATLVAITGGGHDL